MSLISFSVRGLHPFLYRCNTENHFVLINLKTLFSTGGLYSKSYRWIRALQMGVCHNLLIICFVTGLIGSAKAHAAESCPDADGSSRAEVCILTRDIKELEKQLNEKYEEVVTNYSSANRKREKILLIDAQEAWVRYRDKACKFENEAVGGINSISLVRCFYRMTQERLEYFENSNFIY